MTHLCIAFCRCFKSVWNAKQRPVQWVTLCWELEWGIRQIQHGELHDWPRIVFCWNTYLVSRRTAWLLTELFCSGWNRVTDQKMSASLQHHSHSLLPTVIRSSLTWNISRYKAKLTVKVTVDSLLDWCAPHPVYQYKRQLLEGKFVDGS